MTRDFELPTGFQDADFEVRELEAAAARSSALRRRGFCDHGWTAPADPSTFHSGKPYRIVCNHCGATFADSAEHMAAVREARQS